MWSSLPSLARTSSIAFVVAITSAMAVSCTATSQDPDSEELVEDAGTRGEGVSGGLTVGATLKATGNVNLRASASTNANVLHVIAGGATVTVEQSAPSNGFYKVKHNGTVGWTFGQYYEPAVAPPASLAAGSSLVATADVNLRSGPSTSNSVLTTVPTGSQVTVVDGTPNNGFYKIDYKGTVGWSSGKYYGPSSGGGGEPVGGGGGEPVGGGGTVIDNALARAKSAVGFSYWWGHGRFREAGPTSSTKGSCSGSCPSCSHSGSYGGDCSGLVAKVWQVPASNDDLSVDSHPYSTVNFNGDTSSWSTVPRASLKAADAMVYNSNGAGHIFVYSKGDGWGSMYAYECRGCSAGCIAGYRTASSAYHGIHRKGY